MNASRTEYKENLLYEYSISHKITEHQTHANTYHMHDALEVIFIRKGTVSVTVNEENFEAHDNSVLLFNPTDLHGLVPQSDIYDRYVLYFNPEFLETLHADASMLLQCFYVKNPFSPNHITLTSEQSLEFNNLFEQILQCNTGKDQLFARELEQKYLIALALIKLNRLYTPNAPLPFSHQKKNNQIVYNTIIYIQKNIDSDLSLSRLATVNYVGKNRLCRAFAETLGQSPAQYVLKTRIAKAKHLLLNNCHIDEVCEQCGFHSLSHFSRTFRTQVGVSPSLFAKEHTAKGKVF